MLACGVLGVVAGAGIGILLLGHEVDRLSLDNALLMDDIEYLANRVALLDTRGPLSGPYVEAVEVNASGVERSRPSIEQELRAQLSHLIGEELDRVNAGTIHRALERTIVVDRQEYAISVEYIYITPTLRVYVQARTGARLDVSD